MRRMNINLGLVALMAESVSLIPHDIDWAVKGDLKRKRRRVVKDSGTRRCRWTPIPEATAGRNHPCPCGSSKKFKHCHLKGLCNGKPLVQENANESVTSNQNGCDQYTQATVLEPLENCRARG